MDGSIRSTLLRTTDIILRRKWLLIVPLAIMLPVGVACAFYLSGGYAARSLVMLQEQVASNPLAHDVSEPNADRMAQTLHGLRALLSSEYVLSPVVANPDGAPLDPVTRASRIKELGKNVSVDLLGNDFLEFRLAGSSSVGLGGKLQSIMTNLISALMAPPGETAGLFALRSLEDKLAAAERQSDAFDTEIAALPPSGPEAAAKNIADWTRMRSSFVDQLAAVEQSIARSHDLPPGGSAAAETARAPEATRADLQKKLAVLTASIDVLKRQLAAYYHAVSAKTELSASINALRARVEAEKTRFGGPAASWSSMINAPERMIVVDPPKDPELRSSSRLYFVLSAAFGGLLLGAALVILAEIFDTTLRTPEQMLAIAGVPCLGCLPALARSAGGGPDPLGFLDSPAVRLFAPARRLQNRRTFRDG